MTGETFREAQEYILKYMLIDDDSLNVAELVDWWTSAWSRGNPDRIKWLTVAMLELTAYQVEKINFNDLLTQRRVASQYFPSDGSFETLGNDDKTYSVVAARAVVPARNHLGCNARAYVQLDSQSGTYWSGPHEIAVTKVDQVRGVNHNNGTGVYCGSGRNYVWFTFDYLKSAREVAQDLHFYSDIQVGDIESEKIYQSAFLLFMQGLLR